MKNAIFYLGLALLFTHELDAMPNHEWRVLPLLRLLEDSVGQFVFVIAHVPLFAIIIGLVASLNMRRRRNSRTVVSAFLVAHTLLHWLFSDHPHYHFDSILSSVLIVGAGLCGAVFLVLEWAGEDSNSV
ncbi:MAG: DUF6713 family protein [Pseudomonadota bacterium]|mgnify:CR=1 FL=1